MQISVTIEGEPTAQVESQRCAVCVGGDTIGLAVRVRPPPGPASRPDNPPAITLRYGLLSGRRPDRLLVAATERSEGAVVEVREWGGRIPVKVPPFWPLRIRLVVEAGEEEARSRTMFLIPRPSFWTSWCLVLVSVVLAIYILVSQVPAPRFTLLQTLLAAATAIGSLLVFPLTRGWFAVLRESALPFFGLVLLPRAILACVVSFAALGGLLRSCVVVVHNQTHSEVVLSLPWRPAGPDRLPTDARISLVPEDAVAFRRSPLGFLDRRGAAAKVVCVASDDEATLKETCPPSDAVDAQTTRGTFDWLDRVFEPPRVTLRCGARWPTIDGRNVLKGDRAATVHVERDDVWLWSSDDTACDPRNGRLWYTVEPGDAAAHHIQYPWSPAGLDRRQKLWVSWTDIPGGPDGAVVLASRSRETDTAPEPANRANGAADDCPTCPAPRAARRALSAADEAMRGAWQETRIEVPGPSASAARGWPVPALDERTFDLELVVGKAVSERTDAFLPGATLTCRRNEPRGTGFRATRLPLLGRPGWLTELASGPGKVTRGSRWALAGGTSPALAAPWICDAFPGSDPALLQTQDSQTEWIEIHADQLYPHDTGAQAVVLPTHLMASRFEIHRTVEPADGYGGSGGGGVSRRGSPPAIGLLQCDPVDSRAQIAVGRVRFDGARRAELGDVRIELETGGSEETSLWQPNPAYKPLPGEGASIWMCWHVDDAHAGELTVTVTPVKSPGEAIRGSWSAESGWLKLDAIPQRRCFHDETSAEFPTTMPPGTIVVRSVSPQRYRQDAAKRCDIVVIVERKNP